MSHCIEKGKDGNPTYTSSPTNNNTNNNSNDKDDDATPPITATMTNAGFYVLSGCSQPLIMTICKQAGLADPSCQLYMVFYYLGPASVIFSFACHRQVWPSKRTISKACGIALFDIGATTMNYTGASLAGPTIFAIVYASVTVWTAVFSQLFLGRSMNPWQWTGCFTVFGGLVLTATDADSLGDYDVLHGLLLVLCGSALHALTYIMSEGIMTITHEQLSVRQNCAVQGIVAALTFGLWQIFFTIPRFDDKIWQPMQAAETTWINGLAILGLFSLANLVHASTFFHTLKHFPGGATSAGVMKGLQAVLVFLFTHVVYCGRIGGEEMCFSKAKFLSLVTVTSGVIGYGVATRERETTGRLGRSGGYERVEAIEIH